MTRKELPVTTEIDKKPECVCSVCGSPNVEYAAWYNPNTREVGEVFGSWNYGDNTYCQDCGENHDLASFDGAMPDEYKRATKLYAKWQRKQAREATHGATPSQT